MPNCVASCVSRRRSLGAWEAYQRGLWHEGLGSTADHERAKQFFLRASELDTAFASPYLALAEAYLGDGGIHATLPFADAAQLSAVWAQRALAIDPEDADTHATMAYTAMVGGRSDEAHEHLRLAKASNPDLPNVFACEGFVLLFSGQPAEARQAIMSYLRLDPRGPRTAVQMQLVAISHYYQRDYHKAVEAARRTVAGYPALHLTYRWLAAALGQLGRVEEARQALQMAVKLSPQSFEFYARHRPPWHRPQNYEHMLDALRKAGWKG